MTNMKYEIGDTVVFFHAGRHEFLTGVISQLSSNHEFVPKFDYVVTGTITSLTAIELGFDQLILQSDIFNLDELVNL